MKVLVTGALGHIGSKLIRSYAEREDIETIRILDNLSTQRYCSLFELPENKKYEFIEGDVLNDDFLNDSVKDMDLVIHLAGITDAPSTLDRPEETRKVNYESVEKIVRASFNAGVKKFLFPSTTSVYGEAEGLVSEDSPEEVYKPASPYAEAKRDAEKFIQRFAKENNFDATVLRMGTIFGISIGARFHTAINKFCYLAALNKPLTVWDSALNSKRPYLGLDDCVRAFQFLEKNGDAGEIYNVLTANYSMGDILDTIKKFKPDMKIEITKSPLLNQKPYEVSNKKIKDLGFDFKDDISKGVKNTINLFCSINNP